MIDEVKLDQTSLERTSIKIEEARARIQRENARRYAFYSMLHTTDRILWRLEEMNRDGIRTLPATARRQIREQIQELPAEALAVFDDSDQTQAVLDSIFDMQERLFKWRNPQVELDDDDLERLAG
jgi:division protein CdvB (Snf7/Vps24/ESCRT-III family)